MYYVSYIMYHVSCIMYHVSCIIYTTRPPDLPMATLSTRPLQYGQATSIWPSHLHMAKRPHYGHSTSLPPRAPLPLVLLSRTTSPLVYHILWHDTFFFSFVSPPTRTTTTTNTRDGHHPPPPSTTTTTTTTITLPYPTLPHHSPRALVARH